MATKNLTSVRAWFYRELGTTVGSITLSVYEGNDPNNVGALLYTDSFTYASMGAAPSSIDKTWVMDVNAAAFIFIFTPTYAGAAGCPSAFGNDMATKSSGYTENSVINIDSAWSGYGDCGPYDTWTQSPSAGAITIEIVVDSVTKASPEKTPPNSNLSLNHPTSNFSKRMALVYDIDPPEKAINPDYADGENGVPGGIDPGALYWEDGVGGEPATSYNVLFGTDFGFPGTATQVATGITDLFWAIPENISEILGNIPQDWLNAAQSYKWRIDSIGAGGTTTGDEWEFTTTLTLGLGGARNPTPIDTATGIKSTIASLTWEGCEGSTKNKLYLGTASGQLSKVRELGGSTLSTQVSSLGLVPGKTYYWRVDTSRAGAGGSPLTVTGNEWFFVLDNDMTATPLYGTGGLPTIRLLTALTDTCLWYEDLI
jgi:hypothetical protein